MAVSCSEKQEPAHTTYTFSQDDSCTNECQIANETQCAEGKIRTCMTDAEGCRYWTELTECPVGSCRNGEECSPLDCDSECSDLLYTACTCSSSDPCGWQNDGYCDAACADAFPEDYFTDGADCESCNDGVQNSDEVGVDCGGSCPPCDDVIRFKSIDVGGDHACVMDFTGHAYCWGRNDDGQAESPTGQYLGVAAGYKDSCGLTSDGEIDCWGKFFSASELPDGPFVSLDVDGISGCALDASGHASCWGNILGHGSTPSRQFLEVKVGWAEWACGIDTSHHIVCWGTDSSGNLDSPSGEFSHLGVGKEHACAVALDGHLECWGYNYHSQAVAPAGTNFVAVDAGRYHTCALNDGGQIVCFGSNASEQCDSPQGAFAQLSLGWDSSCALDSNGVLTCWGTEL
ncbi:MAG: hypothetical protein A2289_17735 [Deltaproteobacteria bacterium RIFOXYA12_FULL_58_15]|nr:MAG: hypothetical protein A2289_17735 [Deltaproteobacteria bacterium RIFOXYA12_FULL_58_15]OGR14898.1 MAG: hypothetical protein A2341_18440 [Deltaproteobacteria bacterium RIFOXYB12_FULL_58_9]